MDNTILPSNEVKEFEERLYLNPNLQVEETTSFIDNLRNTQKANNQEIAQQTQALGTNVPSNLGGLTGAGSYFTSRYQTPQTNSAVANLRSVAQAAALNQALQNEQDIWKKRYNEAYRAYQKNAYNKSGGGYSGGSGGSNGNTSTWNGQTTKTATDQHYVYWLGQDGNVWVTKNGVTQNLGTANMVNGQWDGQPAGSNGSMSGDGTRIDDPNPGGVNGNSTTGAGSTPPNVKDYLVDVDEKYKKLPSGWRYILEKINGEEVSS